MNFESQLRHKKRLTMPRATKARQLTVTVSFYTGLKTIIFFETEFPYSMEYILYIFSTLLTFCGHFTDLNGLRYLYINENIAWLTYSLQFLNSTI